MLIREQSTRGFTINSLRVPLRITTTFLVISRDTP